MLTDFICNIKIKQKKAFFCANGKDNRIIDNGRRIFARI